MHTESFSGEATPSPEKIVQKPLAARKQPPWEGVSVSSFPATVCLDRGILQWQFPRRVDVENWIFDNLIDWLESDGRIEKHARQNQKSLPPMKLHARHNPSINRVPEGNDRSIRWSSPG